MEANYLTLGLIIPYLRGDDLMVLKNLLCLNKRCTDMLRMPVYKQVLFYTEPERLRPIRINIWNNILLLDKSEVDY